MLLRVEKLLGKFGRELDAGCIMQCMKAAGEIGG